MIPGLDPLTIGSALVLAAATPACVAPERTQINVVPQSLPVQYDYSLSMAELQNFKQGKIAPHSFGKVSYTQGITQGEITLDPQIEIGYKTLPDGRMCAWYSAINVTLELNPTVIIAREVGQDSCRKRAVIEHEAKHVHAEREVINKYAKVIGDEIYKTLSTRGFQSEAIPETYLQPVVARMQEVVLDVVQHQSAKMHLERLERQRAIDTMEEYTHVTGKCASFQNSEAEIRKGLSAARSYAPQEARTPQPYMPQPYVPQASAPQAEPAPAKPLTPSSYRVNKYQSYEMNTNRPQYFVPSQ